MYVIHFYVFTVLVHSVVCLLPAILSPLFFQFFTFFTLSGSVITLSPVSPLLLFPFTLFLIFKLSHFGLKVYIIFSSKK